MNSKLKLTRDNVASITQWANALGSGTYPQAKGALVRYASNNAGYIKEVVGYCCLGVKLVIDNPDVDPLELASCVDRDNLETSNLPYVSAHSLGLPQWFLNFLAELNDSGVTFNSLERGLRSLTNTSEMEIID